MTRNIGVLGGGQLGRMLALAGYRLGCNFRFFDHASSACAGQIGELILAEFSDTNKLDRFAEGLDVVTYEFENVPVEAVRHLALSIPVYPSAAALTACQDRLEEKQFLRQLGIPTASFADVSSTAELRNAAGAIGCPCILKTRRMGYDGKGQVRIAREADCDDARNAINNAPAILEAVVPFERELSLLTVRSISGETVFYPLVENHHEGGILRKSIAPAPGLSAGLQPLAEHYCRTIAHALNYVGVLAVEFFQVGNELMVNEMAPRVHNSGHWTIEGAVTSQFENHLRAILDLPLGSPAPIGHSVMFNCIGSMPDLTQCLQIPELHYHDYGKAPREGRKVGHITVSASTETQLREFIGRVQAII